MKSTIRFAAACALLSLLTACGAKDKAAEDTATVTTTETTTATTAPAATTPTTETPAAEAATAATATFDISSVPVSTANLGTFPYLSPLQGYSVHYVSDSVYFDFDRYYFFTGKSLVPVEGKVLHRALYPRNGQQPASELMVRRNYENLLKSLGAVKLTSAPVPSEAFEKMGQEEYNKHGGNYLTGTSRPVDTYVIRQKDKEVWMQLYFAGGDWYGLDVLEKAAMPQQVSTVSAADIKKN